MPAKLLYPTERRIYHPELPACPHCGQPTQLLNYLSSDKCVQTLTTTLTVATRPGHCPDPACPGATARWRSVAAQQIALPGCTYGLDVVARLGRLRQEHCLTFAQVHATMSAAVQIALSTVRVLYHEAYLPLLAVTSRTHTTALTRYATQEGGLLLALDGLAPEGGEPQLWCVYELQTGLLLRAGWLSQFDQATFETFLQPLVATWPIRAVLSDKQRGLEAAIGTVFPTARPPVVSSPLRRPPGRPAGRGRCGADAHGPQSGARRVRPGLADRVAGWERPQWGLDRHRPAAGCARPRARRRRAPQCRRRGGRDWGGIVPPGALFADVGAAPARRRQGYDDGTRDGPGAGSDRPAADRAIRLVVAGGNSPGAVRGG